ncbi:hypothetical protein ACFOGI_03915 [Virgibacillus xinjiangensis]|uniref:Spore coat protein n=1 Tax=Virgibacillus xinjiangensis TaxID=393090 RepID=A0ABV7CT66_9BACI
MIFTHIFLILLSIVIPSHAAAESTIPDSILIQTFHEDIAGDGYKETIELKGTLFSDDTNYYRDIGIDVSNKFGKEWKISYGGGYEPELQFLDLNHDGVKDVFYQSATGGSGGLYNYQLHTFKGDKLEEIPLPEQPVSGEFQDNFKAMIKLTPTSEEQSIDVSERKTEYIELGIYDESGKLIQPKSLMIDPIAYFDPILVNKNKGYGLKSYQQISGAYHADQLGTIETLWFYEDDNWIILQTKWLPTPSPQPPS